MPSHRLFLKKREGRLEWNHHVFRLTWPDGELSFVDRSGRGYRHVDLYELFVNGRIELHERADTFKAEQIAIDELRAYIEDGIIADGEYREALNTLAKRGLTLGLIIFILFGGLFASYCLWAAVASGPPPGSWIRWAGPLIHVGLCVVLALALVGPLLMYKGLRVLKLIRRLERKLPTVASKYASPGSKFDPPYFDEEERVSIWVGTRPFGELPKNYFEEDYEDDNKPISPFAADFGFGWYDHDFIELIISDAGPRTLSAQLEQNSYSKSFRDQAVAAATRLGLSQCEVHFVMYDFAYQPEAAMVSSSPWLRFIGYFPYRKDA